ncbi:MAG: bifunctional phosphoribosylaminoimidazolecarboxamide formyltransferase/IMP cyclohydrolase, partial [Clostridiales bacterium]|nr:bifunctional phosphoribosylaminoimidazolecarboxamide formyltransferase/IMP cyclohydrolase [Clostridiales bacterium]
YWKRKTTDAETLSSEASQPAFFPPVLTLSFTKIQDLRYGENSHQKAAFYRELASGNDNHPDDCPGASGLAALTQLHGKELSFNNIHDAQGALALLREFDTPAVIACKHATPCGAGCANVIAEAYRKAYTADPVSVFGGVVAINRTVDAETAAEIAKIFVEIVLAPGFTDEAFKILSQKKSIRLLQLNPDAGPIGPTVGPNLNLKNLDLKKVSGGLLAQEADSMTLPDAEQPRVVTKRAPTEKEWADLLFAWKIVKHVKSNGIAIGKNGQSIGIGSGQVNRIWAARQAIEHGRELLGDEAVKGAALASDGFFPFPDCALTAAEAGVTAIIQPGGSVNDQASIETCDQHGIAMVFTGMRHFKH